METKIMVDMLNEYSVSIKSQNYAVIDESEYAMGNPHRRAYTNNEQGRIEIQSELAEPYLSAVMTIWGDSATVQIGEK